MVTFSRTQTETEKDKEGSIASEYEKLNTHRDPYLRRARDCAKYTIPTLMPMQTTAKGSSKFQTPYQGVGARGVNNLASKLMLALFPPNHPFFRLSVDEQMLESLGTTRGEVEEALSIIEQRVVKEINSTPAMRVQALEGIKQLLNSGNVLLHIPPKEKTLRVFRLDRYVVSRDSMGNVLSIIVKEDISYEALPKEIREELNYEDDKDDEELAVYTKIEREETLWEVTQEIKGIELEDTKQTYPLDKCPWLPLRLIALDNEDYGRSYVEEYLGDLISLEGLTKAIVEGSAAAAKTLFFVSPNGTTRKRSVSEAPNLSVLEGNAGDVTVLRLEKSGDFRVALETINMIIERLSFAFMLNSAVQRSGERVTAEEIRYVASELEDSLGGIYSTLAQDFQLPFVTLLMNRMQRQNKIPALPKGMVSPTIVTGMEGLGRTADLQRLDMFLQSLAVLGQEAVAQYLNVDEYIKRRASALQIETKGLVRTREEIQAEQQAMMQQQQQAQMMQAAIPNAVKGVADAANQPPPTEQG